MIYDWVEVSKAAEVDGICDDRLDLRFPWNSIILEDFKEQSLVLRNCFAMDSEEKFQELEEIYAICLFWFRSLFKEITKKTLQNKSTLFCEVTPQRKENGIVVLIDLWYQNECEFKHTILCSQIENTLN